MNAGLDAAIGDYVYEFDSTQTPYPIELVFESYRGRHGGAILYPSARGNTDCP